MLLLASLGAADSSTNIPVYHDLQLLERIRLFTKYEQDILMAFIAIVTLLCCKELFVLVDALWKKV